jgi:hypothetical protein
MATAHEGVANPASSTASASTAVQDAVTQTPAPGGTVTTDTEGDGATPSDPVETALMTPSGGSVSIQEVPATGSSTEFSLLGQQINITAPVGTVAKPLVLTFLLDASIIPAGQTAATIQVFRNGVQVPKCTGPAGQAKPNPCVSARTTLAGGDVRIQVLTTSASAWNFGVRVTPMTPASLAAMVTTLNLPAGEQQSLVAKLEAAQRALERDDSSAASGQLDAFINHIEALLGNGRMDSSAGNPLIAAAQELVSSL